MFLKEKVSSLSHDCSKSKWYMIFSFWRGVNKSTNICKILLFWRICSYDSCSRASNFIKFAKCRVEPIPKRDQTEKSTLHKILAISFSFPKSFYFHDRLSVSGGILIFVRVDIIDKRTILTTNCTLTGFTQPHENRCSSNRNSHGLSKG